MNKSGISRTHPARDGWKDVRALAQRLAQAAETPVILRTVAAQVGR